MKFQDYKLKKYVKQALEDMGIHTPTEIQEITIPKILESEHATILAQAKTGTGKTLAYAIPLVEKLNSYVPKVQAVILVPTRELCKQISEVISTVAKYSHLKTVSIYGGVSISKQIHKVRSGAQIVIATPGRFIDLVKRRALPLKKVKFIVLDEADRMLDMGFLPDIKYILFDAMKNVYPRLLLFSATMLQEIKDIALEFGSGQELFEINVSQDDMTVTNCKQYYYRIKNIRNKYASFVAILQKENPLSSIIFVNTKRWAIKLKKQLAKERNLRLRVDVLQGDLSQRQRETVLGKFRSQKIDCLIATNVAARGLDIPHVTHIFNYDLPREGPEIYVHRIGRTSRMESEGKAISLAANDQMGMLRRIEAFMNKDIQRLYLHPTAS